MNNDLSPKNLLDFRPGGHYLWLVEKANEFQEDFLPQIIRSLTHHRQLLYLYSIHSRDEIAQGLAAAVPQSSEWITEGRITILPMSAITSPQDLSDRLKSEGRLSSGIVVCEFPPAMEGIEAFEHEFEEKIPGSRWSVICLYLRSVHPFDALQTAFYLHPNISFHNSLFSNPYYLPHEAFSNATKEQVLMDTWLHNTEFMAKAQDSFVHNRSILQKRIDVRSRELKENRQRYKSLFNYSPYSIWEYDYSGVWAAVNRLREQGVKDFRTYFTEHPDVARECILSVNLLAANQATLDMYHVKNKEGLDYAVRLSMDENPANYYSELLAVAEGKTHIQHMVQYSDAQAGRMTFEITWMVVPDHEHDFSRVIVMVVDTTEKVNAQRMIERSEQKFRKVVEQSSDAIVLVDENGAIIEWNRSAETIFGYPADQVIGRPIWEVQLSLAPGDGDDAEKIEKLKKQTLDLAHQGGSSVVAPPHEILRPDGAHRTVQSMIYTIKTELGYITCGMTRDITEHHKAEIALFESERQFRNLYDHAPLPYQSLDRLGKVLTVNQVWLETMGYSRNEVIGRSLTDFLMPASVENFAQNLPDLNEVGSVHTAEVDYRKKNGTAVKFLVDSRTGLNPDGRSCLIHCILTDITKRKMTETNLRESEERYRQVSELTSDSAFSLLPIPDGAFRVEWITDAYKRMVGYTPEEIDARGGIYQFVYPDDLATFKAHHARWKAGEPSQSEYRLYARDGRLVWLFDTGTPIWNAEHTHVMRILGVTQDITRYKQTETALRESEYQYRALFETLTQGVIFLDETGRVSKANPAAVEMLGLDESSLMHAAYNNPSWTLLQEDGSRLDFSQVSFTTLLDSTKTVSNMIVGFYNQKRERYRWFDCVAVPQFRPGESAPHQMYAVFSDITERKNAEATVRENEERYRNLVELTPDPIYIQQGEKFVYLNPAAVKLFGASSPAEILGQEIYTRIQADYRDMVRERIPQVLQGQPVTNIDEVMVALDGSTREVEVSAMLFDYEHAPAVQVILHDVTDKKSVERDLLRQRQDYQTIFDSAPTMIIYTDMEDHILKANRALANETGIPIDGLVGNSLYDLFPQNAGSFMADNREVIDTRRPKLGISEWVMLRTGEVRWLRTDKIPYLNPAGNLLGVITFSSDETERLRAEENLRETTEKLEAIIHSSPLAILAADKERKITLYSPAAESLFGWSAQEIVGNEMPFIPANLTSEWDQQLKEELSGALRSGLETVRLRKDGSLVDVSLYTAPLRDEKGEVIGNMAIFSDISQRRRAERDLIETNQRLNAIIQSSPLAILSTNMQRQVTLFSPAAERLFGWKQAEVVNKELPMIPKNLAEKWDHQVREELNGLSRFGLETVRLRKDGSQVDVSISTAPLRNAEGEIIGNMVVFTDISQRKRAEEALVESNQLLQAIIHSSPLSILASNRDLICTIWSPAAEELFGWKAEEVIGRVPPYLTPDEVRDTRRYLLRQSHEESSISDYETVHVRKDGVRIQVSVSSAPLFDAHHHTTGWMAIYTDISQRKRTEEQLRSYLEQMRSLSAHLQKIREEERTAIAREIHDELGQALTGLKMDLFWLKSKIEKIEDTNLSSLTTHKIASMLMLSDMIIDSVRRISTELRPSILDTLGVVAAIEWLARDHQDRSGTPCSFDTSLTELDLAPDLATTVFRICQEALTNVARHANATQVNISLDTKDSNLVLEICDNGSGITEQEISNPKSLGILGMKERAHIFGGEVTVGSGAGKGTRVRALIPLVKPAEQRDNRRVG